MDNHLNRNTPFGNMATLQEKRAILLNSVQKLKLGIALLAKVVAKELNKKNIENSEVKYFDNTYESNSKKM